MWVKLGILSGVLMVAWGLLRRTRRRKPRTIDVGSVSESWLAEHRGRTTD
jgi:hypothetical protein